MVENVKFTWYIFLFSHVKILDHMQIKYIKITY